MTTSCLRVLTMAMLLVLAGESWAADPPTPGHRAAITRYLTASRTVVVMRQFALPIAVREAAIKQWGFDSTTLGLDTILGMEAHVDEAALETSIAVIHARHITAPDAAEIAQFYESELGRRLLRESVGNMLPSADPLFRDGGPPRIKPEDQRALEQFMTRRPAGQRLAAVQQQVAGELMRMLGETADRAVGDYVRAKGLSNTRKSN